MTLAQKTSWGLMNDWLGLIAQIASWSLSTPSSFILIDRKFFVHPAITASISQNKNEWMLHWNLGKNSVTIVCGHQAIIIFFFFRAHFLLFTWFSFWLRFAAWQQQQRHQLASEVSSNFLAIYSACHKAHRTCESPFKFVPRARLRAPWGERHPGVFQFGRARPELCSVTIRWIEPNTVAAEFWTSYPWSSGRLKANLGLSAFSWT